MFDPHETSLPLPAKLPKNSPNWRSFRSTGLKLNLPTVNPEDVQDQLAGYCPGYSWTNCKDHIFQHQHQSSKSYPCTIFRLPLRTSSLSEASEIKSRPFEIADVEALFHKFRDEASETMIFLRSVEYVCLRVWEDGAESPTEMYSCSIPKSLRSPRSTINTYFDRALPVLSGADQRAVARQRYLQLLQNLDSMPFPSTEYVLPFTIDDENGKKEEKWLVSVHFGGEKITELAIQSCNPESSLYSAELKLVPIAQVCAWLIFFKNSLSLVYLPIFSFVDCRPHIRIPSGRYIAA